jgi:hypothetical protein
MAVPAERVDRNSLPVTTEIGEFKGKKVLIMRRSKDDKFPFTIGVNKAKMVLEVIPSVKAFVDTFGK